MHIPAMDALRHERVGIVSDDDAVMVLKAYVQTEDTEERGAYDPVEGFARPFPMMLHSGGRAVGLESLVRDSELEPFSDELVEFTDLLYQSMNAGEWVDELDSFEFDSLSAVEQRVADSLHGFATADIPQELFRSVYESANRLGATENRLNMNSLRDVSGRERYNFEYLPIVEDVDEWRLLRYVSDVEVEGEDEPAVSESLWVRYTVGDSEHERPLVAYQNEVAGLTASSESVDFGSDGEDAVTEALIESMLSGGDTDGDVDSHLGSVDSSEIEGTRTEAYFEAFLEK